MQADCHTPPLAGSPPTTPPTLRRNLTPTPPQRRSLTPRGHKRSSTVHSPARKCLLLDPASPQLSPIPEDPRAVVFASDYLLSIIFTYLDAHVESVISCAHVCREWRRVLLQCKHIWDAIGAAEITPVFPAWHTYARDFRGSASYGYAVLNFFATECHFCSQATPWYLAMIGARVCLSCFHRSHGPVEMCTLAHAHELGYTEQDLAGLPFVRAQQAPLRRPGQDPNHLDERTIILRRQLPVRPRAASPLAPVPKRAKSLNVFGLFQSQGKLGNLNALSYHRTLAMRALPRYPRVCHVYTEAGLRQALRSSSTRGHRDGFVQIVLHRSLDLSAPLQPQMPASLVGVHPGHIKLRIRGAIGAILTSDWLELRQLTIEQYDVPAGAFMCAVQADNGAVVVMRNCTVLASGSAVRGLRGSQLVLHDNLLVGITAVCLDLEDNLIQCTGNTLSYYGEWHIQVVANQDENPEREYGSTNSIELVDPPFPQH